MLKNLILLGALTVAASAQSPLTTNFAGTASLGGGATVYFDLTVNVPISITQLDVNLAAAVSTAGSLDVRWCLNSYVGNDTNAAAWTLGGSGPLVSAGPGQPTTCTIAPFTLPPGNYGIAVTHNGLGPLYSYGNGTATPGSGSNQTYANADLTLRAGATAGTAPGLAICCTPRVFNGGIHYTNASGGTIAARTPFGSGCYRRDASFYELFATAAAFDLANTAITMQPNGNGYTVRPGLTSYVPPTANATTLVLGDDAETTVPLAAAFPHVGGATNYLTICSNGHVSVAVGNGTTFTPSPAAMLDAPQTAWWNLHDYNPAASGSGQVKFEQIGAVAYVTWDGVYDYGGTSAANANTFQFQFDTTTGAVHLAWQSMSVFGNGRLVGYSPGGASADPGTTDLSTAVPATFTRVANDIAALALAASARPLVGTTISLATTNVTGSNVGVTFLSAAQIPAPGVDLGIIGAPGCAALVDVNVGFGAVIGNVLGLGLSVPFAIPAAAPLGFQVHCQSVWLDATQNAFGLLSSNGIALTLGNL